MRKALTGLGVVAATLFAVNVTVGLLDVHRCLAGSKAH